MTREKVVELMAQARASGDQARVAELKRDYFGILYGCQLRPYQQKIIDLIASRPEGTRLRFP